MEKNKKSILTALIAIGFAVVAYGVTSRTFQPQETFANMKEIQYSPPPPYRIIADIPLNHGEAVQVVTVERGSFKDVPVKVVGLKAAGDSELTVKLNTLLDAKLDDEGKPDPQVSVQALVSEQRLTAQFEEENVSMVTGKSETINMQVRATSELSSGTYVLQIRGISDLGHNIGTIIYVKVI